MEKEQIAVLVRKAQGGDGLAMDELLQIAYPLAYKQCNAILKHPEDAQDMTQETLIQITRKLDTLADPEKFVSWSCRIAANQCLNLRKRHPKDLQFAEDEEGHSVLDSLEDLDEQRIPDAAVDNAETRRMISELVDRLPDAQRVCTYLFYYDEMSVKEIAQELGVPENTVKSRLNYARKSIKDGVLDYEKQGVKLYGLSPLPFLLYFLRTAAQESCDQAAAAAAAAKATAVAGTGAAGGATAGNAGVSGHAGSAVARGAGGVLKTTAAKVTAAVLAGSLALGGIRAALPRTEEPAPVEQPPAAVETLPPEETPSPEPSAYPGGIASYTMERTTNPGCDMIYLEAPVFEETTEGYRRLNEIFDNLREKFQTGDDHNIAYLLGHLDTPEVDGPLCYTEVYEVVSQDENTVTISVYQEHNFGELKSRGTVWGDRTFDAQTGELTLTPEDLQAVRDSGMYPPEATDAEIIASVRERRAESVQEWIDEMTAEFAKGWYEYGDDFFVFCRPELYSYGASYGGHG